MLVGVFEVVRGVSIHAPARGATVFPCLIRATPTSFNPRTREGCDPPDINSMPLL